MVRGSKFDNLFLDNLGIALAGNRRNCTLDRGLLALIPRSGICCEQSATNQPKLCPLGGDPTLHDVPVVSISTANQRQRNQPNVFRYSHGIASGKICSGYAAGCDFGGCMAMELYTAGSTDDRIRYIVPDCLFSVEDV